MLNGIGQGVGSGPLGGGTSLSMATMRPCDIMLPPAVMSEATTMDLPTQMAGDVVGRVWDRDTCILRDTVLFWRAGPAGPGRQWLWSYKRQAKNFTRGQHNPEKKKKLRFFLPNLRPPC